MFLPAIDAILDDRLGLFYTDEHYISISFCNMTILCGGCCFVFDISMVVDASRQICSLFFLGLGRKR